MQGAEENILTSTDKLLAFKNKIQVWKKTPFKWKYRYVFASTSDSGSVRL
jgi:hypothetical protein